MKFKTISRKEEILLLLSEAPREFQITMPLSSTQPGIRADLELSKATCSFAMAELESEHLVKWKMAHIDGFPQRLKAYVLTPEADQHVRTALAKLELLERAEELTRQFGQLQLTFTISPRVKG